MTGGQLLIALTLGAAALALWSYVRWPGAAPATMKGAIVRVVIALALLRVGIGVLDIGNGASPFVAILVVLGSVVPVLTFAFLTSIWFMKVCADQMNGGV
jgi:hypothetical protein